jgi:hypothetical protein
MNTHAKNKAKPAPETLNTIALPPETTNEWTTRRFINAPAPESVRLIAPKHALCHRKISISY